MLWLTGAVGQEVHSTDGVALGRVIDLTIRLTPEPVVPDVARVLVQTHHGVGRLIDWDRIEQFEHDRVESADTDASSEFPIDAVSQHLASDELLLCRDVLDTQIVDVVGHRLARVADVAPAAPMVASRSSPWRWDSIEYWKGSDFVGSQIVLRISPSPGRICI
jgi:sporulation protein YlmC with PRC-barrel domain